VSGLPCLFFPLVSHCKSIHPIDTLLILGPINEIPHPILPYSFWLVIETSVTDRENMTGGMGLWYQSPEALQKDVEQARQLTKKRLVQSKERRVCGCYQDEPSNQPSISIETAPSHDLDPPDDLSLASKYILIGTLL
jgi:hypothetical protein